jgi:hypothetical protein
MPQKLFRERDVTHIVFVAVGKDSPPDPLDLMGLKNPDEIHCPVSVRFWAGWSA